MTLDENDIEYILINQFSTSDGYILIVIKKILYVFDSNVNYYYEQNFTYDGKIQNLIPLKKKIVIYIILLIPMIQISILFIYIIINMI